MAIFNRWVGNRTPYPELSPEDRDKRIAELIEQRSVLDLECKYYEDQKSHDKKREMDKLMQSYVGRSFRATNTDIRKGPHLFDKEIWFYIYGIKDNRAECVIVLENMICIDSLDVFYKPSAMRKMMTEEKFEKAKMWIEECDEIPVKAFLTVHDEVGIGISSKVI